MILLGEPCFLLFSDILLYKNEVVWYGTLCSQSQQIHEKWALGRNYYLLILILIVTWHCRLMPSGLKPSYILLNPKTESSSPDQDKSSANNSKEHQENSKANSGGKYKLFEFVCNLAVEYYQLYVISCNLLNSLGETHVFSANFLLQIFWYPVRYQNLCLCSIYIYTLSHSPQCVIFCSFLYLCWKLPLQNGVIVPKLAVAKIYVV